MFPWSDTFELFAGTPGRPVDATKVIDCPRLGTDVYTPILGPISAIDALGYPGWILFFDEGRLSVLCFTTEHENGRVWSTRSGYGALSKHRHLLSFPDNSFTVINGAKCSTLKATWGDLTATPTALFHPSLTNHKDSYTSTDVTWWHESSKTYSTIYSKHIPLYSELVYPLATLSPGFTICVIVEDQAGKVNGHYLGVASTELQDGLHSKIGRLYNPKTRLDDYDLQGSVYLLSPKTNMFYTWYNKGILMRCYNVISSHT